MNSADATHTFIISKDGAVVAGVYVKVTKHQWFITYHTRLNRRDDVDFEAYLVTHIHKNYNKTTNCVSRVFGVIRVKNQEDQDANDNWLLSLMEVKFKHGYLVRLSSKRQTEVE